MLITRQVEFSASHVCRNPALSEEENRAIYGPAANPNGHGHNYILEVTLDGTPDPVTGMVFDLKELKENIAVEIWRRLEPHFGGGVKLRNVRLFETGDLYVDYSGEQ